jgi:hypothetical protein
MVGKRQLSFAIRTVLTRLKFQPSRWGTLLPDPMAPDGKNALCRSVPVLKWGLEGSHFPQQCQQPHGVINVRSGRLVTRHTGIWRECSSGMSAQRTPASLGLPTFASSGEVFQICRKPANLDRQP